MPTIAIVGAGPGMGLAIARTFGARGFDVALIARNRAKLDDLTGRLGADGITAAAFPADVMTAPSQTERDHLQHELDFQLYGAIAATRAVLPAMRNAGAGTLLYTTGAGSIDPVPLIANVNAAAAALRNWAINLHKELAGTGVQAAHVGIDVSVDTPALPGAPTAPADEIARVYWELHTTGRDDAERVFTTGASWAPAPGEMR